MKPFGMLSVMAILLSGLITSYGQVIESEVPGDNFSLEGALELFKKSSSPEEFERMLNSPDSKVNNLDLNGDGYVDYIRVLNKYEGNVHTFILQAVISDRESQDIAVIELEKLANGKAVLQIIGDEDIYGVTTIIEPTREVRTYAGTTATPSVVNVWTWPSVQYVYSPYYDGWVSPWGWHTRPVWYRTWRPVAYVHYHTVWHPYHRYYTVCHTRRVAYAHRIYQPYRTTSVIVYNRHYTQINNYRTVYHHNNNNNRNGRTRNDNRYVNNSRTSRENQGQRREDYNRGRSSSLQRETTSGNRPVTGERTTPNTTQRRNTTGVGNSEVRNRNTGSIPTNQEQRRVGGPAQQGNTVNESRPVNVQQRSVTREQNNPADLNRNNPTRKEDLQNKRSGPVPVNNTYRTQMNSENKVSQVETRQPVQQRSTTTREQSAPRPIPSNSGAVNRNDAPVRSAPAIQPNNQRSQQVTPPPSGERKQSLGNPNQGSSPSRPEGNPSGQNRRK